MKRLAIILGIITAFSACRKVEQSYTFRVSNSNSQDITVSFNLDVEGYHADTTYSYTVPAGATKDIFIHLQPDGQKTIDDIFPVPEPIYSNFTVTKSGQTASTDFLQQGQWTFTKENDYTGIYDLDVDSLDF